MAKIGLCVKVRRDIFFSHDLPPDTFFKKRLFSACVRAILVLRAKKFSLRKMPAFSHVRNIFEKA